MLIKCPKCQKQGNIKGGDELVGREIKCPGCGAIFQINNENQILEFESASPQQPYQQANVSKKVSMFCRNCGKEVAQNAEICLFCGARPYKGTNFCSSCGATTNSLQEICIKCGVRLMADTTSGKSKLAAGLFGIFLGGFGIHRFYLGYIGIGILQIIVTLCTCGCGALWGFIEGILILAGKMNKDAKGNLLTE